MTTPTEQDLRSEVQAAIAELTPLVEVSHSAQEEIRAFRERYDRKRRDEPLPPKSLREIREGRRRYLHLQEQLADIARRYIPLTKAGGDIDPTLRFQALSVSLTAATSLYDNYLSLLTILKVDSLRRLLNHPDYGYGIEEDAMWKIVDGLNSPEARGILSQLVEAWMDANETSRANDPTSVTMRSAVESSISFRFARDASLVRNLPTKWRVRRAKFMDSLYGLGDKTVGAISKAFGNGIGMVELRTGKLHGDEGVLEHLLGVLQPLDLLLEKTPFRLTDFFIPGHFGHVAVWMGTDAELEDLGVWRRAEMQEPPLSGYRAHVRERHSVLEALRSGVELNTLRHFLNVDDVAVLRPLALSRDQVVESLIRGFQQVGKEYDFNFDVETTGTIVCSELPYHVYPGIEWKTESQLGRFTINPDDIASLAESGQAELLVLYHDGRLVDPDAALERMTDLMADA